MYEMITQIIEKFKIDLPKDLINKLNLKIGDNIAIEIEDDKIIIKPVLIIPKAQAWLWSKELQQVENQAENEVVNVPVRKFNINQDVYEDLENW
ncbi:MAG: antitoxin MazE [Clostridium sp.]|jgi:antitoxin MazE